MKKFVMIQETYSKSRGSVITAKNFDEALDIAENSANFNISAWVLLDLSDAKKLAKFILKQ